MQIEYDTLIEASLKAMVRRLLIDAAKHGLPGEHHFYITFRTEAPGVDIGETLKARWPDEMTIVLQHQFWDLKVTRDQFSVGLSFNAVPHTLVVPFSAITAFADPHAKFGLQFAHEISAAETDDLPDPEPPSAAPTSGSGGAEDGGKIVAFDRFRKK